MIQKKTLTKKQRRILVVCLSSLVVYLAFKYLLPVILPFLVAYLLARVCEPLAERMEKRVKAPKPVTMAVLLIMISVVFLTLIFFIGKGVVCQAEKLINSWPKYEEMLYGFLSRMCERMGEVFNADDGMLFEKSCSFLQNAVDRFGETALGWFMENSAGLITGFICFVTVFVIIFVASLLCIREMGDIREFEKNSLFAKEIAMIKAPIVRVGKAYLKTELIIMMIVIGELMLGLSLMGNRYSMLLGLLIGLLDALPLFGTGTVLIPWFLVELVLGRFKRMAIIGIIYLVCYFTRELLEPRLMGDGTGLSPLTSLFAIYLGLNVFGFFGLFLGPIAFTLIRECVITYDGGHAAADTEEQGCGDDIHE